MPEWTVYWCCEGWVDGIEADTREQAIAEAKQRYEHAGIGQLVVDGDRNPIEFVWAEQ